MPICDFRIPLIVLAASLLASTSAQSADTATTIRMRVGDRLARSDLLRQSVHRYLRYMIDVDGRRAPIDIWTRTLTVETGSDGRKRLHLHQQWDEAVKPPVTLYQDSWFDPATMAPADHTRRRVENGATTASGIRMAGDRIHGIGDLAGNRFKDFSQVASEAPYNWEADMEYLAALPLRAGVGFSIPFFDPATPEVPAARYVYRVTGSDKITTVGGLVDCWRVEITFPGEGEARFWFAKSDHVLVLERTTLTNGQVVIKLLLPPEPAGSAL